MKYTGLVVLVTLIFFSCNKEENGCANPHSPNYDSEASITSNNSNCELVCGYVFELTKEGSMYLQENGIDSLHYFVDGSFVVSSPSNVYHGLVSNGAIGEVACVVPMNGSKTLSPYVEIKDGAGTVLKLVWKPLDAGTVVGYQLAW